mgnify:CR=1 FL=1
MRSRGAFGGVAPASRVHAARIARARETIAGMKDPDDVDANSETKVALDALDAMLA